MSKKIICVIPARLKSSRFPQKVVTLLAGKPLVQWTWESALATNIFDEIIIAVDAPITANIVSSFGGNAIMTPVDCPTGTHRMIEVMKQQKVTGDVWVNWQCDEPFIQKTMIQELLQTIEHDDALIWTLKKKIVDLDEIASPHVVKVVCDVMGNALYFSRHAIPFLRKEETDETRLLSSYYKHVGIYAYTSQALSQIANMPPCPLEESEKLEQLRFLFYRITIRVHETKNETLGIDTPIDLQKAEQYVAQAT